MQKKKIKNKSFNIVPDTKKINDNFSSEKSKFKSTLDVESQEAHKIKSDNLVLSASLKEISNNESSLPLKSLIKVKSFQKDELDSYSCNEIIGKKNSKHLLNRVHSPLSKNIDHTIEMENENIQNISNLIETDEIKINSGDATHNITSFDNEKDKHQEREKIIFTPNENVISLDQEQNENDLSNKKVPLFNYMQVLYDQNSERVRKRSQQMKKMKERLNLDNEEQNNLKESTTIKKSCSVSKTSKVPCSTKVFIEKEEDLKETISEQIVSNNKEVKNDDAQLVISDLDCPIEEEKNNNIDSYHTKNTLSINLPSSKSFIQITNNLLLKSHAIQDNATSDYLLALNQCESQEENSDKIDNKSDGCYQLHKRLPSFKNYVVDDVIEEENSECLSDSEFVNRKKSMIFLNKLKSTNSNSDKKDKKDSIINNINNNNTINNAINLNVIFFSKLDGRNSKSEVPSNYIIKKKSNSMIKEVINFNHKISKSEIFNLQVNLKNILDELENKKKIEEENFKINVSKKKKLILDKFLKSNSHNEFTSKLEEDLPNLMGGNIKKNSLNTPKNSEKKLGDNLTFKKPSPSALKREKCYYMNEKLNLENIALKDIEPMRLEDNSNSLYFEVSTNKDIIEFNVDKEDNCCPNMVTPRLEKNSTIKNEIADISVKKSAIIKRNSYELDLTDNSKTINNLKIKDTYKHHRKKSSFFNSDDLRVSKQENFKIIIEERTVNKNLFNLFAINSNKSSNILEFENDKQFIYNNNDNSLVKISDSKSEISQNNQQHETLTSNLTSMISFINNNTNHQQSNKTVTQNTKLNMDMNTFDFDFKDSPVHIRYPQEPSHQIYFSYDGNSNTIESNTTMQNRLTTQNDFSLNKKTKSLDLLSISNQVNINIMYNNTKRTNEKTRNLLYPQLKPKNNSKETMNIPKNIPKIKGNASTQNLRKKYIKIKYRTHYKAPSMNINYQMTMNSQSSTNALSNITTNCKNTFRSNSFSKNVIKPITNLNEEKIIKQSIKTFNKKSDVNTPNKINQSNKNDLKQYLTFSESIIPDAILINQNLKTNYLTTNNEKCNSSRFNSESSFTNIIPTSSTTSNRKTIIEAIKALRFQKSSLDHQKTCLEKLSKIKTNLFSIMMIYDSNTKNYEFRGIYEINEEKNNLHKIYSINSYPQTIEINDIQEFFSFNTESMIFKKANEVKKLSSDLHAFSIFGNKPKKI